MTYTSHLQLWFELGFGFLKAILSLIVGSHNVSHRATENEFGVAVQQQSCYVTSPSLTIPTCVYKCRYVSHNFPIVRSQRLVPLSSRIRFIRIG